MASMVSATDMISRGGAAEPLVHGGDLGVARRLFPGAPEPFIDLSTGINPHPYHLPQLSPDAFARLPERAAVGRLATVAARAYGAPSASHVVPAPGTQILLPQVAALVPPGRAAVLGPTYAEHMRVAALVGHRVKEVTDIGALRDADLVILVNPNSPDGRIIAKDALLALADDVRSGGGVLVVDEAFMDVGPARASLAAEVARGSIVVLRSFGKFFGLAGLRLGFALAAPEIAARLGESLGPWPVSGPAITVGEMALADTSWAEMTRSRLAKGAIELDKVLTGSGLEVVGGTSLFRLVQTPSATELFHHLGRAGILVRRFVEQSKWLRFGLPASDVEWRRLHAALVAFDGWGRRRIVQS
jgi:cobalamin biosynthesis protein CobC